MKKFLIILMCFLGFQAWAQETKTSSPSDFDIKRIKVLAESGDPAAQTQLARCYRNGLGVPENREEALKWYTKAANQSYAPAQTSLGTLYRYGWGVPQDAHKAIEWYTKAANQNYARAETNLGAMYLLGQGIEQDSSAAFKWYSKAANRNYARAQAALGRMYYRGNGVEKNLIIAYKWVKLATLSKNEKTRKNAEELLKEVQQNMNPIQIQEGNRLADDFLQNHAAQSTSKKTAVNVLAIPYHSNFKY